MRGCMATRSSRFSARSDRRFDEYAERAKRLASALHAGGVKVQDRIGLLAMNCAEYLEIYGVSEVAPFVLAPVNFRLAAPEILYVLRDSAPTVLFFEKQYEATIAGIRDQLPGIRRYICFGGAAPDWAEDYEAVVASGAPEGPGLEVRPNTCTRSSTPVARQAGRRAR